MEILPDPNIANICFAKHRNPASLHPPQFWALWIPDLAPLYSQKMKHKDSQTVIAEHFSFTNENSYLYPRSKLEGILKHQK